MNLCKLKTVLFDLDGTLLDTAPDLCHALNKLLEQEGYEPVDLEEVRQVASDGTKGLLALGMDIDPSHPSYQCYRDDFLKFYQQHLSAQTKLFSGMDIVLDHLEEQGIQWGVVTNKPTALTKNLLEDLNLHNRAACVIGANCTSRIKPYPDSLLLACEITRSSPRECVYIGDAERDIEAAKYAGMRSIAALYGYLRQNSAPEYWHADYYIDQPKDILFWVEKQRSCCLM